MKTHPASPKCRNILVVDDNLDAAETLAMALRTMSFEVETAHDGFSAVDAARRSLPDLVLLDIGLPGLDGYEVARRLRALDASSSMRIVAVTGYDDPTSRERAIDAGVDVHLIKPVELTEIRGAIASVE